MAKTIKESLYLSEVHLSGYKSINSVDIDFQKGLNIIIGKNAAGKTNFLKFLSKLLTLDYSGLNNFSSKLTFLNGQEVSLKTSRNIEIEELFKQASVNSKISSTLTIAKKIIKEKKDKETGIEEKLAENNIVFDCTFLCHGIPKDYLIVDKPFSFRIDKNKISVELADIYGEDYNPYFLKSLAIDILIETFNIEGLDIVLIRKSLNSVFKKTEELKKILKRFSPIEDMRFSENFNVFVEEGKENITINNIFLEFKIDGNWLPFANLSDGTKRLFYIISEIHEVQTSNVRRASNGGYFISETISRIILIEEPELGIHPHQFHKLMEFLKEESEKKQIIISTHSPQALDSIDQNEFNRITIAYTTHAKEGTKLRHLNELEQKKANEYIKDDFLSDYWLYSDLEK